MPRQARPPPSVDFRAQLRCRYCGCGDVGTIVDSHHATPQERWEQATGDDESPAAGHGLLNATSWAEWCWHISAADFP